MNVARQEPVAITGMGLICRQSRPHAAQGGAPVRNRFYAVEMPAAAAEFARDLQAAAATSRSIELAFGAAISACSGTKFSRENCGAAITVSKGLTDLIERSVEEFSLSERTDSRTAVRLPSICEMGPDAAAIWIARALKLSGPAAAAVAACATGLASLKLGIDWLRDGICDSVLAGAAESSNSDLILRSFERLGVISLQGQTRPFDARRDGFVVGEGAAVFRIERCTTETNERAQGRILGIAFGADGHHLTTPDMKGTALSMVVTAAIHGAGLEPEQIGWIHAHGTATAYNDPVEANVLRSIFGKAIPPVTATKGMTGHLLGASGAVALALTLDGLRGGYIPPVAGLECFAEEFKDIDFVTAESRCSTAKNALVLNHGFGGHLAAAVVGA